VTPALADILDPVKAMIFRITHRENLGAILDRGIPCRSSPLTDPSFVSIGNEELIHRRAERGVDLPPFGTLADYVPFYFTPSSPMLLNILTGVGVAKRQPDEILILVSSLDELERNDVHYLFTDRHAYMATASYFSDRSRLEEAVDYPLLRNRDFSRDPEHPERFERYQAELLAHQFVPREALIGVGCYTSDIATNVQAECDSRDLTIRAVQRPEWFFQ
jgi:hypothetical protein